MEQFEYIVKLTVNTFANDQQPDVKEDLLQECRMELIISQDRINEIAAVDGRRAEKYVYAICRNVVVHSLGLKLVTDDQQPYFADQPLSVLERAEKQKPFSAQFTPEMVRQAVSRLAPLDRHVINATFFEGKTEEEVGRDLGKTRNQIKYAKEIALQKLRNLLE